MPRRNTKNLRGINFAKSAEEVKSERFTIKFTKSDFERIQAVIEQFNLERMAFSRDAIMKSVEHYEKRMKKDAPKDSLQGMPKEDAVKQVLALREKGLEVYRIAKQLGLSTKEVRDILGITD